MTMRTDIYASGSSGNCYRVGDGETSLLLECGIPYKKILSHIDFDISSIGGVLISHEHGDHAKNCKELARLGLDIYASTGTFDALGLCGYHYKPIKAHSAFDIGTLNIYPFDVQHDVAEPLGFVITSRITKERLLFFTDTYYVRYVFKGITHIMAECNYSVKTIRQDLDKARRDRLFESHMSLEHLIELLGHYDMSKVKKIYLMHLSDDNSDEEMFRREIRRATGAEVIVC